ncbi:MAG: hypothetical protein GXP14_05250 [Gammaproteobacteria bacterium]|nr:hypothetical protein [Gammaproteobacteria bacterium]
MFNFLFINSISLFLLIASTSLEAIPISFELRYSDLGGSSAQGNGSVTFDRTTLPNPGLALTEPRPDASLLTVLDFNLTITGARVGNGTFGLNDFTGFRWEIDLPLPLDLNSDLIGQLNSEEDFDFAFSPVSGSGAPISIFFSEIRTNEDDGPNSNGDILTLVSMTPVPAPGLLALVGLGLVGVAASRRLKKKA